MFGCDTRLRGWNRLKSMDGYVRDSCCCVESVDTAEKKLVTKIEYNVRSVT